MVISAIAAPSSIIKRDGRTVPFTASKIEAALEKCFSAVGEPSTPLDELVSRVVNLVSVRSAGQTPTVEGVQDIVELVLQSSGEFEAAKHYILYRAARTAQRIRPIPDEVTLAFKASDDYFPTPLQKFQYFDKYSRFDYDLGRRETWMETTARVARQLMVLSDYRLPGDVYAQIDQDMLHFRALPSMRMVSMAGPAFTRDNATQYNCTYTTIDDPEAFVEGLLLSMAGCGVGFSVESRYVEQLPRIKRQASHAQEFFVIEDSTEGWGDALRAGLDRWMNGFDIKFDYSLIRPRGAPLRIKGGRASGHEPLQKLLDFARRRILARQGSFLRPIDAHDIMCMVGSAAVSGGVRRTAMISLFDESDHEMLTCKSGNFEQDNNQRWNANNSMVWDSPSESMSQQEFIHRFMTMVDSGRGEPGIFSREAALALMPDRRVRTDSTGQPIIFGTNPCGEIVLRPQGMCNLTTVIARSHDTLESLLEKVETATVIGTIQSLGTHFPTLRRPQWKTNAEEERLLGVSIGGQQDCPLLTGYQGAEVMTILRQHAIATNDMYARQLGIAQSASITCVKPDGNSSQLVDASSGLHARWAPYYIRNVRVSATSPVAKVLRDSGVPLSPENGDDPLNPHTWVISFPVKAPSGAITRNNRSAIEQCNYWLKNKLNWTEHNPSVTITYRPHEVLELMAWVWSHRAVIGGMAFLPAFDADYAQLPYIEISAEEYEVLSRSFPDIDFSLIYRHETDDRTTAAQELACLAGVCEVEPVPEPTMTNTNQGTIDV